MKKTGIDQVLICSNHREEYPVPLIWTYKFRGAEQWCPFCGQAVDLFSGCLVDPTPELAERGKNIQRKDGCISGR
jgi:hypothetical protein